MTEPTEDRAERAFRRAFAGRALEVDVQDLAVPQGRRRRATMIAVVAAAAAVVAAVVPVVVLAGDSGNKSAPPASVASEPATGMRWVGYRGIEVQVPEDWPFAYGPSRPECVRFAPGEVPLGDGVRTKPYVEIEPKARPTLLNICLVTEPNGRGPEAFGELPFAYWQPHLQFADAAMDGPPDGEWRYRGWTLKVDIVDGVRISLLAGPQDQPDLAASVLGSLRRAQVNVNRCEATSSVQAVEFARPESSIPAAAEVHSIAVCQYERTSSKGAGLIGYRRIDGPEAQTLVEAIHAAPTDPGPDDPRNCSPDMFGDEALSVRFLDADHAAIGEAFVYYDWCFGNGIFDARGGHALTVDNCAPLFAAPPVSLWSASRKVFEACHPSAK